MLAIAYDPNVPRALRVEMERAARDLGLPLEVLERLAHREANCRAFVLAVRAGDRRRMAALAGLSENALPAIVHRRRARPHAYAGGA